MKVKPPKRDREDDPTLTLPQLCAALTARAVTPHHGGILLGSVLLSPQYVEPLRNVLQRVVGGPNIDVRFRGIDPVLGGKMFLVHLRTASAVVLEGTVLPDVLSAFMESTGAKYFSAIRMFDPLLGRNYPFFSSSCSAPNKFTFAEIFAGIGGFRLGLSPLGGQCVMASEIDPGAVETYASHFGPSDIVGDICELYADHLPYFDILTAGFPCQPFSNRGDQKGFSEPRGQLYLELVRLLRCCKPRAFLFENVSNLVHMDEGKTLESILVAFRSAGYDVSWRIVNASQWLPQYRERVYMVGFRSDLALENMDWEGLVDGVPCTTIVRDIMEPKDCVSASVLSASQYAKIVSMERTPSQRVIPVHDKCPTLISSYHNASNVSSKFIFEEVDGTLRHIPRFLSPRECARLMGFPEYFGVPADDDPVARAQFYRQIGNAVCPPVIAAIGAKMVKALCTE